MILGTYKRSKRTYIDKTANDQILIDTNTASSGQSWAISLIQLKKQAGGVARIDLRNTKAMTNTSMSLWI